MKKQHHAEARAVARSHDSLLVDVRCDECGRRQPNRHADSGFMARTCSFCPSLTAVYAHG